MALLWKILSRLFFEIRLLTAGMVIAGRVIHHFFATRQATKQPPEPTTSSAVPEPPTPHIAQRQEEAPATPAQPGQPDISKEQITPEISTIPTLSKVPIITPTPPGHSHLPRVSDEQVSHLMALADRFMCTTEMASSLAIMRAACFWHQIDGAALQGILRQLAYDSHDTLEYLLAVYTLASVPESSSAPHISPHIATVLRNSARTHNIEGEREHMLAELSLNKRTPEQRLIDLRLIDRVRIIITYCYFTQPEYSELAACVAIKPAWEQWLQQGPHTLLELGYFLAQQTRTVTGALITELPPDQGSQPDMSPLRRYYPGDLITAEITGVQSYGAFIEPEPGIKGLIHKNKTWLDVKDARICFSAGDVVTSMILKVNEEQSRLELSMQIPEYDPLLRYHPGDTARGKVTDVQYYGAFVELEPGVTGLLHVNDMGRPVSDAHTAFKLGDEVEVLIIRRVISKRHLSLADAAYVD